MQVRGTKSQNWDSLGTGQVAWVSVNALLTLLFMLLGTAPVAAQTTQASEPAVAEYRLLAGDEISVKMPLNPELDASGPIGPDGGFSIPLAGRIPIGGLTLGDAERRISDALREAKVVANARPGIVVAKYMGAVYVGGEVRTPGAIPLTRAMNPLQAILSAGGMLNSARTRKVAIIRQAAQAPQRIETVNIRDIVKTGGSGAPVMLSPGDVIFVPKSTIAEVNLFIDQFVNGIVPNALHFNVNMGNNNGTATTITP